MDLTAGDLVKILDGFSSDKRLKVLYLRKANQLWEYKVVNVSEDELGVNLIIESARKLASNGR